MPHSTALAGLAERDDENIYATKLGITPNRCISEPALPKTTKKPKAKSHPAAVYLVDLVG
jgi:hypothetical protein